MSDKDNCGYHEINIKDLKAVFLLRLLRESPTIMRDPILTGLA